MKKAQSAAYKHVGSVLRHALNNPEDFNLHGGPAWYRGLLQLAINEPSLALLFTLLIEELRRGSSIQWLT